MNSNDVIKLPRLYVDQELTPQGAVALSQPQAHYLRAVLRRQPGDQIRLFNGRQGEWLAEIEEISKKGGTVRLAELLRGQPPALPALHLCFAPIKKSRMDWLVEKAVELGATHLQPLLTRNTEARRINDGRVRQQIIEAAEQCERLDVPALAAVRDLRDLPALLGETRLLACLERERDATPVSLAAKPETPVTVLIGPEGGFTAEETEFIRKIPNAVPVSLGEQILRCETAACLALGAIKLVRQTGV